MFPSQTTCLRRDVSVTRLLGEWRVVVSRDQLNDVANEECARSRAGTLMS